MSIVRSDSCPREWFDEADGLEKLCPGVGSSTLSFECHRTVHWREEEKTDRKSSLHLQRRFVLLIMERCLDVSLPSPSERSNPRRTSIGDRRFSNSTCSSRTFAVQKRKFHSFFFLDRQSRRSESIVVDQSSLGTFSADRTKCDVVDHPMGSADRQLESVDRIEHRRRPVGLCDDGIHLRRFVSGRRISPSSTSQSTSNEPTRTVARLCLPREDSAGDPREERHSHSRSHRMRQDDTGLAEPVEKGKRQREKSD